MDIETKLDLVTRNTEEVITREELKTVLETESKPGAYIGFEPSGFVHLGTGLICIQKVKEFVQAGFEVTIFLADWHAFINDKLNGKMENIQHAAQYMKEAFVALGADSSQIKYILGSELVTRKDYWEKVIKIAKNCTLARTKRAMNIMGRTEEEAEQDTSKLYYPAMQAADIYELGVHVAYAGMDQRRVHMLARDVAEKLNWYKPVAIHTPLLMGLKGSERMDPEQAKMSKSDPDTCIYIHDTPDSIHSKLKKAFCPMKNVDGNPVLEIAKLIVFPIQNVLNIERPEKYGGNLVVNSFEELTKIYSTEQLHPEDLKKGVAESLIKILEPVRKYFETHKENIDIIKSLKITK